MIDWFLAPSLAVFQLFRGVKFFLCFYEFCKGDVQTQ